jgi:hypothetical protein
MAALGRSPASGIGTGGISADDVTDAYRWLLGREPDSFAAIEAYLTSKNKADLRERVLLSQEFRDKLDAMAIRGLAQTDRHVSHDDERNAYRWLLGREPESSAAIEAHRSCKDRTELRTRFILSPEFRDKFDAVALSAPASLDRYVPEEVDRLVFLHIPKTGGTTLHVLLVAAVGEDQVSAERHNRLWRCSGAELASARLFSGHYDRRCLSFVPGRRVRVITMLREPRQRLISIYRFLRAHRAHQVSGQELTLAAAARELCFGDFLRAALEINPAAVDNSYLRAFGADLPSRRWEQRSEPEACQSLEELGFSFDELMRHATSFLDKMSAVGILEDFERSLGTIFSQLRLTHQSVI